MKELCIKASAFFSVFVLLFLLFMPGKSSVECLNSQEQVLFNGGNDFFADFFNVQRYISENNPYFNEINGQSEKPYLPICYIIMKPFNSLCDFANMTLQECWESPRAVFSAIIFMVLSLFFFFDSFFRLNKNEEWKFYNSLLFLFSSVFLFTIERGNLIILTVACINYYLAFYESKNVWRQKFALFCLCLGAVMKVYPVVFGLLLLKDKRYKDIVICICCGVALTFIPFLFFEHGLNNIPRLLDNIRVNSIVYGNSILYQIGIRPLSIAFAERVGMIDQVNLYFVTSMRVLTWILSIATLFLAFVVKQKWMQVALLTMFVILFPTNSFFYSGMYLMPFIMLFINKGTIPSKSDYIIILLLCLIFNPIQIVVNKTSVSPFIASFSCVLLWLFLIFSAGKAFWDDQKSMSPNYV